MVYVIVTNAAGTSWTEALAAPGAYAITNLPTPSNYWIHAYRDSNGDMTQDTWEAAGFYAGNPLLLASDESGVDITLSDPTTDSDHDGLTDYDEVYTHHTNPYESDSDHDGMPDGWEVGHGLDPLANDATGDPDVDQLSNLEEYTLNLDPQDDDTDGDGFKDGEEVLDIGSRPGDADDPVVVDDNGPSDPLPGDPAGSDPAEDGSLTHPFDAIQEGADQATNGMMVLVFDGTYTNAGNRDIRPGGKAITIRSRNGSAVTLIEDAQRGFICDSGESSNTVIRGFAIHMGMDSGGQEGIVCDGSSPLVLDCRVWGSLYGLSCSNGAAPVARGCSFENNAAAGVRVEDSGLLLDRCRVVSNTAVRGAGVRIDGVSAVTMVNCLVADNQSAVEGGGVFVWAGASLTNIHCTFAGNAASNAAGGVSVALGASAVFRNAILWGNAAPTDACFSAAGTVDFEYCCLESNVAGTGNTTNDPSFAAGYGLLFGSPAIDAGGSADDPGIDLAGVERPLDGNLDGVAVPDMGAFEYVHPLADTDGDGLLDTNEIDIGTSPILVDTDGDRMEDGDEVFADTAPTDSNSFFRVIQLRRPDSASVTFSCTNSRLYSLQSATNLVDGEWLMVDGQTNRWGDAGGSLMLTDTNEAVLKAYRVGVQLP